MEKLTLGIDFGTDSARAVIVGTQSGEIYCSANRAFNRWGRGDYCDPSVGSFRQHPLDYVECIDDLLDTVIPMCPDRQALCGISVDSTCSTPCLTDGFGQPLSLTDEFRDNPEAMFILWKDKTGKDEAKEIRHVLSNSGSAFMSHCGNTYSAEYTWAKILHSLRMSDKVRKAARGFVEEVDFITSLLTGERSLTMKASRAPAVIKGLWSEEWGGFPVREFSLIDKDMAAIAASSRYEYVVPGTGVGSLCRKYKERYGLEQDIAVSVGSIDSHSAVIGSGAPANTVAMTLGTSACFWLYYKQISGSSLSPEGLVGDADDIMADGFRSTGVGLSAFGDIFAWFKNILAWGRTDGSSESMLVNLANEASALDFDPSSVMATDHFNGRRSPSMNDTVRASFNGLSLSTTAPEMFRALVESAAFATKAAIGGLQDNDIMISSYYAVGGVSRKSSYIMQILADVLEKPIHVCNQEDSSAHGAAVYAAVAAGVYPDVLTAQKNMTATGGKMYDPRPELREYYLARYEKYVSLVRFNENINNQ